MHLFPVCFLLNQFIYLFFHLFECHKIIKCLNGVHPPTFPTGGTCVLSVIRFQDGGRRSAVKAEWSMPKLENDLLRRNVTTNGRKTDLIERYILHQKPKHAIYVRYFSILLYLLNVKVAPTENKTSLKLL